MPTSGTMGLISNWKSYYLVGISKIDPKRISLRDSDMEAILNLTGIKSYIATGLALPPELSVNEARSSAVITPWLSMFAITSKLYPDAIDTLHTSGAIAYLPENFSKGLFSTTAGWPDELLDRYSWDIKGFQPFIMPILIPAHSGAPVDLKTSMKSPDGTIELFWISHFKPDNPGLLLQDVDKLADLIKNSRKELLQ